MGLIAVVTLVTRGNRTLLHHHSKQRSLLQDISEGPGESVTPHTVLHFLEKYYFFPDKTMAQKLSYPEVLERLLFLCLRGHLKSFQVVKENIWRHFSRVGEVWFFSSATLPNTCDYPFAKSS
ncbi:hypothetical protein CEXT_202631 [Caerostris extrusa]|uniref:Maturase K n=1 Tax=Caerostris extrusa TaxID=172846 RepID=A0AAV4S123_CAEEX|nr:hypothetical protein CEXT_202631 [Caerostris extrusa]